MRRRPTASSCRLVTGTPRQAVAVVLTIHAPTTPCGSLGPSSWPGVGEEFPLECPRCGGDIRLIAFITEPGPIRKILTHLGEPLEPPPISPARGPPPTGTNLSRCMTMAMSFRRHLTSCPRSTFTGQARAAGATGSPATHPSGNACGSAIDRAILRPSQNRKGLLSRTFLRIGRPPARSRWRF